MARYCRPFDVCAMTNCIRVIGPLAVSLASDPGLRIGDHERGRSLRASSFTDREHLRITKTAILIDGGYCLGYPNLAVRLGEVRKDSGRSWILKTEPQKRLLSCRLTVVDLVDDDFASALRQKGGST